MAVAFSEMCNVKILHSSFVPLLLILLLLDGLYYHGGVVIEFRVLYVCICDQCNALTRNILHTEQHAYSTSK